MIDQINGIEGNQAVYSSQINSDDEKNAFMEYVKELMEAAAEVILINMRGGDYEVVTSTDSKGHPHVKVVEKAKKGDQVPGAGATSTNSGHSSKVSLQ